MADDVEARAAAFAFADKASDWLEQIYEAAHGPLRMGAPALMLPAKSILRAVDGKFDGIVFVDLRVVIDLIKEGLLPERQQSERGG